MSKSIFITGASSGIGKALAFELAQQGYRLGLAARSAGKLEEIKAEILANKPEAEVRVYELDVTSYDRVPQVINQAAEDFGALDIIFANAGLGTGGRVGKIKFEDHRQVIDVNLNGAMATADAAVRLFRKQKNGHLVATSSIAAFRGMPGTAAYCASKAGLNVFLEALRAELINTPVKITILNPGFIDTPMNDMLDSRPFLINTTKGAKIIARHIKKQTKRTTVPRYPWALLARVMSVLPLRVVSKMGI